MAQRAAAADAGSPEGAQARYDSGRELQLALPTAANASCRPLLYALRAYARAQVQASEAYDRLQTAARASAIQRGAAAQARVERARGRCAGADARPVIEPRVLEPRDGEAFTGLVKVVPPGGATTMAIVTDGRVRGKMDVKDGVVSTFRLGLNASEHIRLLELRFSTPGGASAGSARLSNLTRLPDNAFNRPVAARRDAKLDARLAAYAGSFDGFSGLWLHDLASGEYGSFNSDAVFPAASTVKLGVIAAALTRWRTGALRDRVRYDLDQIGAWSSNLAANRVYKLVGRTAVENALRVLGATRSSYPGEYRAGTSHRAAPRQPPLVSQRVTTAHDLAAILESFQRAASGDSAAIRRSRLRPVDARLAIGILARSQPVADNAGLFTPFLPLAWPSASKQGWLDAARHSAQLIYGPAGPVLAVTVTYRDPLTLVQAQQLGRRVAALAARLANS